MRVRIKKIHPGWNNLYPGEFIIGDICDLDNGVVTTKNGLKFSAVNLCRAFSLTCPYSDIFDKIEE